MFDKQWEKSLFGLNLEVDHIRETLSAGDVVVTLTREIQVSVVAGGLFSWISFDFCADLIVISFCARFDVAETFSLDFSLFFSNILEYPPKPLSYTHTHSFSLSLLLVFSDLLQFSFLSKTSQNVYTAQLGPYDQLQVTSQFQSDVNNLPSKYDAGFPLFLTHFVLSFTSSLFPLSLSLIHTHTLSLLSHLLLLPTLPSSAAYQSFIDTYGTHVVQWGVFGGEAALLSVVENSLTDVYSDLTVSLSMRLVYLQLKGKRGERGGGLFILCVFFYHNFGLCLHWRGEREEEGGGGKGYFLSCIVIFIVI